jgi:hypothetical protein
MSARTHRGVVEICLHRLCVIPHVVDGSFARFIILFALNQLLEGVGLASIANVFVLQQLFRRGPAIRILNQALCYEVLECLAEFLAFETGRRRFRDVEEHLHWVGARVRGFSIGHLHGRDTQRPDVSLEVISSLLDHLGRHPERGPDKSVALRFDVGQLRCDPKVGQLDFAGLGEKDVGGFDITVDLPFAMEIVEAQQELAADDGNVRFAEDTGFELVHINTPILHLMVAALCLPDPSRTLHREIPSQSIACGRGGNWLCTG